MNFRTLLNGATAILLVSLTAASASATPSPTPEVRTAEVKAFESPEPYLPRSANGTTWAPGATGATTRLHVSGNGTYVNGASVNYLVGVPPSNACVDTFEIAYFKNGTRKLETASGGCTPIVRDHSFTLNQHVDAHSKFCGRVKVSGTWSNYACVNIIP